MNDRRLFSFCRTSLLFLGIVLLRPTQDAADSDYFIVFHLINRDVFASLDSRQRELLIGLVKDRRSALPPPGCFCWKEGTDLRVIKAFDAALREHYAPSYAFDDQDRWSTTATNGPGLERGDPTILTWGFLPEGVVTEPIDWWPLGPETNHVIRMMDILYGLGPGGDDLTQRPWFPIFKQVFDRWSQVTGVRYVYEPNDDQAPFPSSPGVLGVRPDIRICAVPIDGAGNGVLAFNDFPDNGDMFLDYDDRPSFGNHSYDSRFLRNVIAHEHGHGLGLWHACPIEQTKLMEPMITMRFDGPQHDDILGANRGYGDHDEFPGQNDAIAQATDLGYLAPGDTLRQDTLSVDGRTDRDYFAFTVPPAMRATISLNPIGFRYYYSDLQAGGDCPIGDYFDSKRQSNLGFELIGKDGSKVLASADYMPLGLAESVENFLLTDGPGTYFIHVFGDTDKVQLYDLEATISAGQAPVALCKDVKTCQPVFDLLRFNDGSYDPDGDSISFTVIPEGPFPPGVSQVTVIVSDGYNTDTCQAAVTVNRPPLALAHSITVSGADSADCRAQVSPEAMNNGSTDPDGDVLTLALVPEGPFSQGDHAVKFVATDRCGASDTAFVSITVTCTVPVRLLYLTATRNPEGVWVKWAVADAADHDGFHVDREEPGGPRIRITDQLLSGENSFAYLDRNAPWEAVSYWLEEWSRTGDMVWFGPVSLDAEAISPSPRLVRIEPNPCIQRATVFYDLPDTRAVTLEIFDARGRKVRALSDGVQSTGSHRMTWDGRDDHGIEAAPGLYIIRLVAGDVTSSQKLVVVSGPR